MNNEATGNQQGQMNRPSNPPQTGASDGRHRQEGGRRNQARRGNNTVRHFNNAKTFKGETETMNGNVFQLLEEAKDPTQFNRTKEALERYAAKTYHSDMRSLFQKKTNLPTVDEPDEVEANARQLYKDAYAEDVKHYAKAKRMLTKDLRALYSVIWGQCSPNLTTKLCLVADAAEAWKEAGDCKKLLDLIKQVVMKYEHQKNKDLTLYKQIKFFFTYRQRDNQSLHKYFEVFNIMQENIEQVGGSFVQPSIVTSMYKRNNVSVSDQGDDDVKAEYEQKAKERLLAMVFLLGARADVYQELIVDLENDFLKGHDYFPINVTEAFHLLSNYGLKKGLGAQQVQVGRRNRGNFNFLQSGGKTNANESKNGSVAGTDGIMHKGIECFRCKRTGHYSNKCPVALLQSGEAASPSSDSTAVTTHHSDHTDEEYVGPFLGLGFLQVKISLAQSKHSGLNDNWILLDTQSNCDIFRNQRFLCNVRKYRGSGLILRSNGGEMHTHHVGELGGYGTVWYNPNSLANILSLANVRKVFRVTMNTGPEDPKPTIIVHTGHNALKFTEHSLGLYVFNATDKMPRFDREATVNKTNNLNGSYAYLFLNTVSNLEKEFSSREVKNARIARSIYIKMGRPGIAVFAHILKNNLLRDSPVSVQDFERATYIYGKDVASIKGKTVRKTPPHISSGHFTEIPDFIRKWHMDVILCLDIFFVNNLIFVHSISRKFFFEQLKMYQTENTKLFCPLFKTSVMCTRQEDSESHTFMVIMNFRLSVPLYFRSS